MSHQTGKKIKPVILAPGEWAAQALCAQTDPEIFFPEQGQSANAAIAICDDCPVQVQCLNYALASPVPLHGVWGGSTGERRKHMRREAR